MAKRKFSPQPGEKISLFRETFTVQAHPQVPYMAYAATGRRATVYKIATDSQTLALKVFKPAFREQTLEENARQLRQFLGLEGLKAVNRRVVLPSDEAANDYPDLAHALLMPWLQGTTWYDLLVTASTSTHFQETAAVHLCERFLRVVKGLESRGIAHTDIAPGNVMINPQDLSVELLDLEDLYAPGFPTPRHRHGGSAGYRHSGNAGHSDVWCLQGDRYAAAVMAAEMLVLAENSLAALATDEGFFGGHYRTQTGQERYILAQPWLRALAPGFLDIFHRTWTAESLQDCPPLADLHGAIAATAVKIPLDPVGLFADSESAAKKIKPKDIPVVWEPLEVTWATTASSPLRCPAIPPRKAARSRPTSYPTATSSSPSPSQMDKDPSTARVPPKRKNEDPLWAAVSIALLAGVAISISTEEVIWTVVLLGLGFLIGLLLRTTSK